MILPVNGGSLESGRIKLTTSLLRTFSVDPINLMTRITFYPEEFLIFKYLDFSIQLQNICNLCDNFKCHQVFKLA